MNEQEPKFAKEGAPLHGSSLFGRALEASREEVALLRHQLEQARRERDEQNREKTRAEEILLSVVHALPLVNGKDLAGSIRSLVEQLTASQSQYKELEEQNEKNKAAFTHTYDLLTAKESQVSQLQRELGEAKLENGRLEKMHTAVWNGLRTAKQLLDWIGDKRPTYMEDYDKIDAALKVIPEISGDWQLILGTELTSLRSLVSSQKGQIERYEKALGFYANETHWYNEVTASSGGEEEMTAMLNDHLILFSSLAGWDYADGWDIAKHALSDAATQGTKKEGADTNLPL